MKSTITLKKSRSTAKSQKIKAYRFWLVLSCAGLLGVWFIFVVLDFFGAQSVVNIASNNSSSAVYSFVSTFALMIAFLLAAVFSLPFAVAVFKRLKIQMPLVSAVAFFMAPTFGFNLFALITGVAYYETVTIYTILIASMIFAGLLYGLFVRPLKHKLSTVQFLSISVILALLPIVAWFLQRLWVTSII